MIKITLISLITYVSTAQILHNDRTHFVCIYVFSVCVLSAETLKHLRLIPDGAILQGGEGSLDFYLEIPI